MQKNKVFVISDERCGGTQFGRIFEDLNYNRIDDPQRVYSIQDFVLNIKNYQTKYDYIKICAVSFSHNQYKNIIDSFSKAGWTIIFLWRNYIERAISRAIAESTGVWSKKNKKWEGNFTINPATVSREIRQNKSKTATIQEHLSQNNIEYYELKYNDLYSEDLDINQRWEKLLDVLKYIDINDISLDQEANIRLRLSPNNRVNTKDVYKRINNINNIIKSFSNDENGFIDL